MMMPIVAGFGPVDDPRRGVLDPSARSGGSCRLLSADSRRVAGGAPGNAAPAPPDAHVLLDRPSAARFFYLLVPAFRRIQLDWAFAW